MAFPPVRILSLALLLAVLWLLMSGHYDALLLGLGALSVVLVLWLSARMGIVDREGVPLQHALRIIPYGVWLMKEILVSNVAVGRMVVARKIVTQPQILRVEGVEHDDVARTLYANSITLTPGTVTVDLNDDELLVHALTDDAAEGLRNGVMQGRVTRARSRQR